MRVFLRVLILIGILGAIVFLIANSTNQPTDLSRRAWEPAMTLGSPQASHHFIVYTDIFCPYCDVFSRELRSNFDQFSTDYLDNQKIYLEYRLTDMISDHSPNSKRGGESGYCAAKQGQFWNYYDAILAKLLTDYHSQGIGVSKTSPSIPELPNDYFYAAAAETDLDLDQFKSCLEDHETLETLETNTNNARYSVGGGIPYFVFNRFTSSGFDGDYRTIEMMIKSGLSSR
jgi:protein-disulfide isomerase